MTTPTAVFQSAQTTHINTEDLAKTLGVNPNTVRRGYCIQGHYMGIKPKKMPNRRLLWPVDKVQELINKGSEV